MPTKRLRLIDINTIDGKEKSDHLHLFIRDVSNHHRNSVTCRYLRMMPDSHVKTNQATLSRLSGKRRRYEEKALSANKFSCFLSGSDPIHIFVDSSRSSRIVLSVTYSRWVVGFLSHILNRLRMDDQPLLSDKLAEALEGSGRPQGSIHSRCCSSRSDMSCSSRLTNTLISESEAKIPDTTRSEMCLFVG
jgi:hypothetical protein